MKASEILELTKRWKEIYKMTDKQEEDAQRIKEIIYRLSSLIGLI